MHPLTSNWVGPYNSASNQWLYAAQVGANWKGLDESNVKLPVAYYDFVGLQGQLNPNIPNSTLNADSAPPFATLGNTMFNINFYSDPASPVYAFASKFRLLDAVAQYDVASFDPLHLTFSAEAVRNVGFNATEIQQRIQGASQALVSWNGQNGLTKPQVNGYRVGFVVGKSDIHQFAAWDVFGGYRYLERDAVPDGFTSLDYRLGGTDQKASILGVDFGINQRVSLKLFLTSANSINSSIKYGIDTWFLDLYGSF
jgi:hypothetical protein